MCSGCGHWILRERVRSYHSKPTAVRQRDLSRETLEELQQGSATHITAQGRKRQVVS